MLWPLYRLTVRGLSPVIALYLSRRVARGKEHQTRLPERWGYAGYPRPKGSLVWLHAASVGESLSLLPLVDRLLAVRADLHVLVTTGTVTSARLMEDRLPAGRTLHQFVPIDHPAAAKRFLSHWRPDLAIWVESELWPTLILATHQAGAKMALINARLSDRSLKSWQRLAGAMGRLLNCFDLILAQDEAQAARLRSLGAKRAGSVGDLKSAVRLPEPDPAVLGSLTEAIGDRPCWLAASTHPGEEEIVAAAHRALRIGQPRLLTILAPRHPARADALAADLSVQGLAVARRSRQEVPNEATDIWLIDSLGELGLFYRLARLVLVAGSMGPVGSVGGHNPMEAASVGCAILHGADTSNCVAATALLDEAGAALCVDSEAALVETIGGLLGQPERLQAMGEAALRVVEAERRVLDSIMGHLLPLLPPVGADDARA